MNHLRTPEALAKAHESILNNLPQISNADERESHITVDHFTQTVILWTNNATVMNRLDRSGVVYVEQDNVGGQVYSRTYEVPFDKMNELMKVTTYKCY